MRKKLSIMMLTARASMKRLVAVLAGMAILEWILFFVALNREALTGALRFEVWNESVNVSMVFSVLIGQSKISIIFLVGLILYFVALCGNIFGKKGCHVEYSFDRLALSKKTMFGCVAVYNILCFFLFWGIQVLLLLVFAGMYATQPGQIECGPQTILLSFYEQPFLHLMLPTGSEYLYIIHIVLWILFGIATVPLSLQYADNVQGSLIGIALGLVCIGAFFGASTLWIMAMIVAAVAVSYTLRVVFYDGGENYEKVSS